MATNELEMTAWAKAFKADSPVSYAEALRLASGPSLVVEIERSNTVLGEDCFAILVSGRSSPFWMGHRPTRKAALALCAEMGWRVRR